MFIARYEVVFALLALVLLLSACAGREPIRLDGVQASANGTSGVLWATSVYRKDLFERLNHAVVVAVDGVNTLQPASVPPVELVPGRHVVQIKYERESYWCGYLGCVRFEQSAKSLELLVEPDHSYLPLARKFCDRDWIWIADTGGSARQQLEVWRERGIYPYSLFDARSPIRNAVSLKVVAGEAPPERCELERK